MNERDAARAEVAAVREAVGAALKLVSPEHVTPMGTRFIRAALDGTR